VILTMMKMFITYIKEKSINLIIFRIVLILRFTWNKKRLKCTCI
jgi:hypothetical protein